MPVVMVGKVFLTLIVLETILLLGLNTPSVLDNDNPKTQFFAGLLMVSLLFINYFAWDGILRENIIQVMACVGLTGVVAFYGIFQFIVVKNVDFVIKVVQLGVVITFFVLCIIFGWKVYLEFGWRIYRKIGADTNMRAMYRVYQILLTMLKLDWAMMVILAAMVSVFVFKPDDYEIIVVIVSVIVMIGWVWLGFFSIRTENLRGCYVFSLISLSVPLYILFRIYRFFEKPGKYEHVDISMMIATGVFGIILHFFVMYFFFKAWNNFGRGLKEQLATVSGQTKRGKVMNNVV